ncbi:DUF7638 domain-containing protein [Paenibacillus xylanexedens]|uniref:DUF7638 domain-containing protein n=1 Tax=Paenibacillus xylanexedens TaxID=528191 RepID=UPI0011A812A2|nr:hypothetical protein [Paenibacillus xylanexedens]
MQNIRRTKQIEGTTTPGIIHNGGHHFLIPVQIYEDGMINCWELVDLKELKQKIEEYWLGPDVPVGETISIHGLGAYRVEQANWTHNNSSYYEHIERKIRALNPEFRNIFEVTPRLQQLKENRRVSPSPQAVDFAVVQELFYETIQGDGFSIFMKYEGWHYLVHLVVYENGKVVIYQLPNHVEMVIDELAAWFQDGTFFTTIDRPVAIRILDLGEVTFSEEQYAENVEDKYQELLDIYKKLTGEQTTFEACRHAYHMYLEDPSEFNRAVLKEKYERVPEHQRMYLGDMDSRDMDYQRIIYSPEEKREV